VITSNPKLFRKLSVLSALLLSSSDTNWGPFQGDPLETRSWEMRLILASPCLPHECL
jgi:hypothetical protein